MVTQKAKGTVYGAMHGRSATVELGYDYDGKPAVKANIPMDERNSTSLAFNDPMVLRDIAGDLLHAAAYLEEARFKGAGS